MDMIEQILQQAKNYLFCPVCNSKYTDNEIRFRGFIDNTYIFQAFCAKAHEPLAITYLASLHKMDSPVSAFFYPLSGEVVTEKIAADAQAYFDKFNGDFKAIFKK